MKVSEFINILKGYHGDTEIVMSADAGGGTFSFLDTIEPLRYSRSDANADLLEIHIKELTPSMRSSGFTEDDFQDPKDAKPCIVLWPRF